MKKQILGVALMLALSYHCQAMKDYNVSDNSETSITTQHKSTVLVQVDELSPVQLINLNMPKLYVLNVVEEIPVFVINPITNQTKPQPVGYPVSLNGGHTNDFSSVLKTTTGIKIPLLLEAKEVRWMFQNRATEYRSI